MKTVKDIFQKKIMIILYMHMKLGLN